VSDFVLDASLALQWFLEDETDRQYSLNVLAGLAEDRALVPVLWFYGVGNGLLMAFRRKRIGFDQIEGFLARLKALPIQTAQQTPSEILELPLLAQTQGLTNYDTAYLDIAMRGGLRLATSDRLLRQAAAATGVDTLFRGKIEPRNFNRFRHFSAARAIGRRILTQKSGSANSN
jgi:predicted nucleic acid-binding protein